MSNNFDDLERRLGSAKGDLQTQLNDAEIPEFRPNNGGARALAVAVALILVGVIGWPFVTGQPNNLDTVDTPNELDDTDNVDRPDTLEPEPTPQVDAPLVTGLDATPPEPSLDRARLGEFRPDPAYGTSVRRLADATPNERVRVASSFTSPESADGSSTLVLRDRSSWHVVNRATLEEIVLPAVGRRSEPHWHPTDPNRIRHFAQETAGNRLVLLETEIGGSTVTLTDLSAEVSELFPSGVALSARVTNGPASDGSTYAWAVLDDAAEPIGFLSFDLEANAVIGSTAAPAEDYGFFDSVRVSPSGTHVIAGFDDNSISYDITFSEQRLLNQRARGGALVSMPSGPDALVTVDLRSVPPTGGWIYWVDLETGEPTTLFNLFDNATTSVSFSTSDAQPGWAVISTFGCRSEGAWSCDKIAAVHLPTGTLVNLAHTYSCGDLDGAEPGASVSMGFERIYFNSDSNSCTGPIEVFELVIPPEMFSLGN